MVQRVLSTEHVLYATIALIVALTFALVPFLGLTPDETRALLGLTVVAVAGRVALIRAQTRFGWARLAPVVVPLNVLFISLAVALLYRLLPSFWVLYFILPVVAALIYGVSWAYLSGTLAVLGYLTVVALNGMVLVKPAEQVLNAGALVIFTLLAGRLAAGEHRQRQEIIHLYAESAARAHRLALLNEFAASVNRNLDLATLLADAQRLATELLHLETTWILLLDEASGEFVLAADHHLPPILAADDKRELRRPMCRCRSLLLGGELTEAVKLVPCEGLERLGITAYHASVPLRSGERVLGLLNVVTWTGESLAPEDVQTLGAMGAQLGVAIERARLHEQVKARRIEEQTALLELSHSLLGLLEPEAIARATFTVVGKFLQPDAISLLVPDAGRNHLELIAAQGWAAAHLGHLRLPLQPPHRSGAAWAVHTRMPVLEDHARPDQPFQVPEVIRQTGIQVCLSVPMLVEEQVIGVLVLCSLAHRTFGDDDVRLVSLIANQTALAYERAWLFEQVRAGREQLRILSQRLLEAQEAERRSIACELHDEIGQMLTGLKLLLKVSTRLPAGAADHNLQQAYALVTELIERVSRLSLDLRPTMLDDLGLLPALFWLLERYTAQTNVQVNFNHHGLEGRRFAPELETAAYRIVQEALTNVARHAGVSDVTVRLWAEEDTLNLQVEDQGRGFDPQAALAARRTSGLTGIRERATLLGGQLTLESAPGSGTRLGVELPLHGHVERRSKARQV